MEAGQTGYARTSDGVHVAYRTWGEKHPVHVFLSEFGATVDTRDMHPSFIRLWRQLAGISQVVSLDRRGLGTSDVVCPQRFDLDDYVLDILAVVDAVGAKEVVLTGEGSAGAAAVAFAVAHPDRVLRLAIVNGFASQVRREDYDIAQFSRDEVIANDLDAFVQQQVSSRGGRVVKQTGDGHLAIFDDPSDALSTAMMVTKGVNALGIEVRGGVHFGTVSLRSTGDVGGLAVHLAAAS